MDDHFALGENIIQDAIIYLLTLKVSIKKLFKCQSKLESYNLDMIT